MTFIGNFEFIQDSNWKVVLFIYIKQVMRKFILLFIVLLFYTQGSYAQIKPGIYKQVRYKIGDKPVENYPFENYKVSDGETIWQIDVVNFYPYVFWLRSIGLSNLQDYTDSTFTNLWVCDMSHKTIPTGETVLEYFDKNFSLHPKLKALQEILGGTQVEAKNNIQGVWRLVAEDTEKYRIYTEGFLLDLLIARDEQNHIYSIEGRVYNAKYNEDSLILDDISGCTFEFLDNKKRAIITNPELGKGVYELFKRSKLPEAVRRIFRQQ